MDCSWSSSVDWTSIRKMRQIHSHVIHMVLSEINLVARMKFVGMTQSHWCGKHFQLVYASPLTF